MTTEQATTVVSIASVLGKVLEHYGLDKFEIARQAGIDTSIAYQPNDRISTAMLQKAWRIAYQLTGDDCMGLTYGQFIQPASLCGLGLAWITSDSLKDSINRLVRYQRAISTAANFKLIERDDYYQFTLLTKTKNPENISVDAAVAAMYKMCQITYGADLRLANVRIAHAPPECRKKFDEFFSIEVEFNAKENQLVFFKDSFEKQLATSNPELARMNDQVVIDYLKQFDKNNIALQVRARVIEELSNGVPNQEKIASNLNMSLRNLQRKLKEEKTNFKKILDETRSELAKQYLRGSDRSIIEVGFLLGFSEASNFSRAFRRWNGMSPHEFRDNSVQLS